MGPVATISILLPLTFGMPPVPAILMLSGVYYGAQYGGAICSLCCSLDARCGDLCKPDARLATQARDAARAALRKR